MLIPKTRECAKCHRVLTLDNFYKKSANKSGYATQCKSCCADMLKKWQSKNIGKIKESRHKAYIENIDREKDLMKKWRAQNPERSNRIKSKWSEANIDKIREHQNQPAVKKAQKTAKHKIYLANREKFIEAARQWHLANPDRAKENRRRSDKKRRSMPKVRLSNGLSCGIRDSLRNNSKAGRHWESLVNYTIDDLKRHLEKQFESGMTWENYGSHWQIDHKIPVAVFNFETPEDIDFHRCWSLKNLQPLESIQNASKGAILYRDFQPSLALAVGGL